MDQKLNSSFGVLWWELYLWVNFLRTRRITSTSLYPHCNEEEFFLHTFFHCQFAKEIWEAAPFKSLFHLIIIKSFRKWIEKTKRLLTYLQHVSDRKILHLGSYGPYGRAATRRSLNKNSYRLLTPYPKP